MRISTFFETFRTQSCARIQLTTRKYKSKIFSKLWGQKNYLQNRFSQGGRPTWIRPPHTSSNIQLAHLKTYTACIQMKTCLPWNVQAVSISEIFRFEYGLQRIDKWYLCFSQFLSCSATWWYVKLDYLLVSCLLSRNNFSSLALSLRENFIGLFWFNVSCPPRDILSIHLILVQSALVQVMLSLPAAVCAFLGSITDSYDDAYSFPSERMG